MPLIQRAALAEIAIPGTRLLVRQVLVGRTQCGCDEFQFRVVEDGRDIIAFETLQDALASVSA